MLELYRYHRWANARTLDAVSGLSPDDFARELGGSFGSVRGTLAHMLGAEWVWLSRWRGTSPDGFPDWDVSTLDALRKRWRSLEADQTDFLEELTPEALDAPVTYRNTSGRTFTDPLAGLLRHVVNHATYHRGQVTTFLRMLDHAAPATDLVLFLREGGGT